VEHRDLADSCGNDLVMAARRLSHLQCASAIDGEPPELHMGQHIGIGNTDLFHMDGRQLSRRNDIARRKAVDGGGIEL
jgi:hypothetical protein